MKVLKTVCLSAMCLSTIVAVSSVAARCEIPVSKPAAPIEVPTAPPKLFSLDLARVNIADILTMIGQRGDVDIIVGADVTGVLKSVHLTDKTPEQAIRIIAQFVGLPWKKIDARTFLIGNGRSVEIASPQADIASPQRETSEVKPRNWFSRRLSLTLHFADLTLPAGFIMLAHQGDLKIELDASVSGQIKQFSLADIEPEAGLYALATAYYHQIHPI